MTSSDKKIKAYLAGPDVFRKDSVKHFKDMKEVLSRELDIVGLAPLDNEITDFKSKTKRVLAEEIFRQNIKLIEEADIIIANLDAFRGPSADPGTVFEVGYAKALGKKVYGYNVDENLTYLSRVKYDPYINHLVDLKYPEVEDFSLPDNLMIYFGCDKVFRNLHHLVDWYKKNNSGNNVLKLAA